MSEDPRNPGWDRQEIMRIANEQYGNLKKMISAHDWDTDGRISSHIVPTLIVKTYGCVEAFVHAHKNGRKNNPVMLPIAALKRKTSNVWLTSFYGFDPEEWGVLGFSDESKRQRFLNGSEPGVLVVIYNSNQNSQDWKKIIGILQCSHEIGPSKDYMSPSAWEQKDNDPEYRDSWNYGVKVIRAWRVTDDTMIDVSELAPLSTESGAWQHIGSRGVKLKKSEAQNIKKFDLEEVEVYGDGKIIHSTVANAKEILKTSKAGPVSKKSFVVRESEGPKHLYILKLCGDTDAFLDREVNNKLVVKAGFSKDPNSRCRDFNRALPECAFHWEVMYSGVISKFNAYPCSDDAKAGEKVMHKHLCKTPTGESLGREFFLADTTQIEKAWIKGNNAAKKALRED